MKKNSKVLVTGSSRGIGKSIAKTLCASGYDVYITGRDCAVLESVKNETGAKDFFVCDLTVDGACDELVKQAGEIDILINNAGDYVYSPVEKTESNDIQRLLKLNTQVPFELIKAVVPHMKKNKWGRVINIGSISGSVGEANASLYSMSKSALIGMTKALALELAADNITVNTINPGWVDTELAKDAVENSDFSYSEEIEMIPQRRFIRPEEIANLALYLASDEAKGMTGQSISLCAGLSVG